MFVEYTHRSEEDFERLLNRIEQDDVTRVSLTNKNSDDDHIELAQKIRGVFPGVGISSTYSIKVRYKGSAEATVRHFLDYLDLVESEGLDEVLIVSGNPKRSLTTYTLLNRLYEVNRDFEIKLGVAFNPFLEGDKLEVGKANLLGKLAAHPVETVYFQLGDDLDKLEQGLEFVSNLKKQGKCQQIVVSILNPSKQILKSLKFRPWHGVRYSGEFLESVDGAVEKNLEIARIVTNFNFPEILYAS
jgi:hypothetical protein